MSSMWNSTGSSMVRMLIRRLRISSSIAYSVVDFPQPVGPVVRNMPWLESITSSSRWRSRAVNPSCSRLHRLSSVSSRRTTTLSPNTAGSTEMRRSTLRPSSSENVARPSCGLRCSARFIPPSTLIRPTTAGCSARSSCRTGTSSSSMRYSTSVQSSPGRRWMSDARRVTASASSALTIRTTGRSFASRCASTALASVAVDSGSMPSCRATLRSSTRS